MCGQGGCRGGRGRLDPGAGEPQAEPGQEQAGQRQGQALPGGRRHQHQRAGEQRQRQQCQRHEGAPLRRGGRQRRPLPLQPAGGLGGERLAGGAQHEAIEAFGAGEAEAARQRRIGVDQLQDAARRGAARGQHQRHIVVFADRQHALGGALDQPLVVDRAEPARQAVERLKRDAEAGAERAQIIFLADGAAGDQHPVGADPDRARAISRRGQHLGGQQVADAVKLGASPGAGGR